MSSVEDVVKDMALTPEVFLRDVPRALEGLDYRVGGRVGGGAGGATVEIGTAAQGIAITVEPQEPRRLSGLWSMPRSKVTIAFHGYGAAEAAAFVARFDKAFQRGGG